MTNNQISRLISGKNGYKIRHWTIKMSGYKINQPIYLKRQ
jgi:hypothetical protein